MFHHRSRVHSILLAKFVILGLHVFDGYFSLGGFIFAVDDTQRDNCRALYSLMLLVALLKDELQLEYSHAWLQQRQQARFSMLPRAHQ